MAYSEKVIDHAENPRNVGTLDKSDPNVGTGLVGAPACLTGDTLVALADGTKFARLDELAKLADGPLLYSYNSSLGVKISQASPVRLTRKDAPIVKVTLDDGTSFRCTPDHRLMRRNEQWVEAQCVVPGDSLMPFNRILRRGYYAVYGNRQDERCSRPAEHKLIYEHFHGPVPQGFQVHHRNHIKVDNRPENLEALDGAAHLRHHNIVRMHVEGKLPVGRDIKGDKNPMREWWSGRASEEEQRLYREHMSVSTSGAKNGRWSGKTNEELLAFAATVKAQQGKLTTTVYRAAAKLAGYPQNFSKSRFGSWHEFMQQVERYNHKVASVESAGSADVYCLSVLDECFAIVTSDTKLGHSGIIVHNCGDVMRLQIKVAEDGVTIEDARFKTFGCGSAIAASSLATEWLKGKTLDEAATIKNSIIVEELSLPPVKIHCSVLAEDAIKAAIEDFRVKQRAKREEAK